MLENYGEKILSFREIEARGLPLLTSAECGGESSPEQGKQSPPKAAGALQMNRVFAADDAD